MKWFYPHLPPAWLARPEMINGAGKTWTDLSKVNPTDNISKDDISYSINSLGYRYEEFKDSYDEIILSLGMSCSFGLGVKYNETYFDIISKKLNIPVLNFAIPGASSDTVARTVSCIIPHWINKVNKIKVILGWPYSLRREIFLDNFKSSINFQNDPPIKEYHKLLDDTSNEYNQEKNQILVRSICKSYNIPLYEIPDSLYLNLEIDKASDGFHPGPMWHQAVADWFLNQLK